MNQPNSWDIGGDAGNSFQFDQIGASVQGTIESLGEVQQTNITSGEPEFWPGGQPKMMYRVSLRTSLRDPANPHDDGKRDIYLKGSRKAESLSSLSAVLQAVKLATGSTQLEPNATLIVTYTGDGVPAKGMSAPKQYAASYVRPAMNLGGQPQQALQQAYAPQPQQGYAPQQPAYQPQQAPQQTYAPQPAAPVAAAPQQAYAPQPQQPVAPAPAPAPAPAQSWPWTDASLAAVRAAGADPATVWPEAWAAYTAAGGR
jgi:hypothetical protein